MQEYAQQSQSKPRTLESNPNTSRQAPIDVILQQYKVPSIQRYAEDKELIQGKGQSIIQRYTLVRLTGSGSGIVTPCIRYIFNIRVNERTATTGEHNYAMVLGSDGIWARSGSNAHAEISLLSTLNTEPGTEVLIYSELEPCPACKQLLEKIESSRDITIKIFYAIPYADIGDGDPDKIREYYKSIDLLSGGGSYVWRVVE